MAGEKKVQWWYVKHALIPGADKSAFIVKGMDSLPSVIERGAVIQILDQKALKKALECKCVETYHEEKHSPKKASPVTAKPDSQAAPIPGFDDPAVDEKPVVPGEQSSTIGDSSYHP
jgi:hypothetical protein